MASMTESFSITITYPDGTTFTPEPVEPPTVALPQLQNEPTTVEATVAVLPFQSEPSYVGPASVPEPSTMVLLGSALAVGVIVRWWRR